MTTYKDNLEKMKADSETANESLLKSDTENKDALDKTIELNDPAINSDRIDSNVDSMENIQAKADAISKTVGDAMENAQRRVNGGKTVAEIEADAAKKAEETIEKYKKEEEKRKEEEERLQKKGKVGRTIRNGVIGLVASGTMGFAGYKYGQNENPDNDPKPAQTEQIDYNNLSDEELAKMAGE